MKFKLSTGLYAPFKRMLKWAFFALSGMSGYSLSAQILLSGTSFDPLVPSDTSRAFWGLNDIAYTGIQGGALAIVPPITPNVNANIFDATYYHAITNNPNKLDRTRYEKLVGANRDNQLVISPRGTSPNNMLTYNVANLLPGSNVEVRVTYCNVGSQANCGTSGPITSIKGVINPGNTGDGFEMQPQLRAEQCINAVYSVGTTTTSGSKAVGPDGLLSFSLSNLNNIGDCKAIGIKSIEIWGTPKPKVFASVGAEVCKGEQITLSATQQYTGVTYQWQVKIGAGSWSNITNGTNSTAIYEPTAAPQTYQFQLIVKQGSSTFTSNAASVNSIVCCQENGVDASRQTIFYDDFGRLDPADKTGKTYYVWDYNNLVSGVPTPIQKKMTSTTAFRWPLTNPPLGATFKATGPIQDGEYAVAAYLTMTNAVNGYNGAMLDWAARIKGPTSDPTPQLFYDHTGELTNDPFGATLMLNCPPNTKGQVLYSRDISNLCNQKKLFFEAWISVFTNSAAVSSNPYNKVDVMVKLTELDAGGNPTTNTQNTNATATRQADGGGIWVPISLSMTLGTGTSFRLELINNQNVSIDGNDLALDDIKVMACAPPSIESYFNAALAQTISVCPSNNDPLPLLTVPSALLKTYYSNEANSPQFLFQWTKTPNVVTSWTNIGSPSTSQTNNTITNTSTFPAFSGLTAGGKVYFRVIAAAPSTFSGNSNFQGSGNEANINKPCKNYSVSEAIEATIACPLPIHLVSFSGEKRSTSNLLLWSTSSEINNSHFVIQRSIDGIHFEDLDTKLGQGNSSLLKSYEYIDESPLEGTNYYRLKQMDRSGKTTYSNTISIENHAMSSKFSIYPNPNNGSFVIAVDPSFENTKLEIIDLNGTTRYSILEFPENGSMELKGFEKGVYFIRISQNGEIKTQKVFIY